ncbi:hypothetical protein ACH5RR_004548 [Cinchona calisaya]|uniref:Fe2OG dioxygenase domain-containing protein n=1 Tax=Cinchona calisaya TaxID=153742 RepID=A0ABD3AXX6_9GENT
MAVPTAPTTFDRMKEVKEFDKSKIGVKGLSDSGKTSIPSIFVHPPETVSTLLKSSSGTIGIPGSLQCRCTRSSVKDCGEHPGGSSTMGFLPSDQPWDTLISVTYSSNNNLYRSKAATWHDYVMVWMAPERPELDQIPELYRNELLAWDENAAKLTETLAELLSEGLGLHSKKLKESSLFETRIFGGMFYPYCPQPDLTVGLSDHTDPGVKTLLLKNGAPGLQVKYQGEWVDVKPLPGSVIINIGDFLEIVSNGEYRSVQHCVLANLKKQPRVSIVHWVDVGN